MKEPRNKQARIKEGWISTTAKWHSICNFDKSFGGAVARFCLDTIGVVVNSVCVQIYNACGDCYASSIYARFCGRIFHDNIKCK